MQMEQYALGKSFLLIEDIIHSKFKEMCNVRFDFKNLIIKQFDYLEYAIAHKLNLDRCEMLIEIL